MANVVLPNIREDAGGKRKCTKAAEGVTGQETTYRWMMEAMPDAVYVCSSDYRVKYMNPAMIEKLRGDRTGEICFSAIYGLAERCPWCELENVLRGERSIAEVLNPKDGRYYSVSRSPLYHSDGSVSQLAAARDLSALKKIEEELGESEEKYKILFESSRDAILLMMPRKVFLSGNAAALEMFGFRDKDDFAKRNPAYLSPEYQPDGMRSSIKAEQMARIALKQGSHAFEWKHKRFDGTEFWASVQLTRMDLKGQSFLMGTVRNITDQKKSQEKLKESEAFNFALFEHNPVETIVVNHEGRITNFNLAIRQSGRRPPNLGDLMYKNFAGKHEINMYAELMDSIKSNKLKSFPALKYGDRFLAVTISPFYKGAIITSQDITERKGANDALRKSEERFRVIIEKNADGMVIVDKKGIIQFANPAAQRLFGRSESDLIGDMFGFPLLSGETTEVGILRSDTEVVPSEMRVVEIRMNEGTGYLASLRDISERKKAEENLGKSEKKYRTLFENSRDPIVITSKKGRFVDVNQAALEMLEYDREEIKYVAMKDLVRDIDELKKLKRETDEKSYVRDFEMDFFRKDGTVLNCLSSTSARRDDSGAIIGYEGIIRDITAQKRDQEELNRTLRRLRKALTSTVEAMALTVETRDPYTAGHQRRVADLACIIAQEMGLSDDTVEGIIMAGTIHDLGKIAVPAEILSKPGKITDIELAMIKTHPQVAYNILRDIEFPWPVAQIVIQHHERIDGSGYPCGLKDGEIVLEAKIICVADVVEAMASHRPYRPALGIEKALAHISEKKSVFYDANVVDACVRLFTEKSFKLES